MGFSCKAPYSRRSLGFDTRAESLISSQDRPEFLPR
jgi:hypothetical protein